MSILLMEPGSAGKRRCFSEAMLDPKREAEPKPAEIKKRLKEVRRHHVSHQGKLVQEFSASLSIQPSVRARVASSLQEALGVICEVTGEKGIAVNKSATVAGEILPVLRSSGFQILETYYEQFASLEDRFAPPLQLPSIGFEASFQSFAKSLDLGGAREEHVQKHGSKDITGILGVSSVSASDGALIMLQHTGNIRAVFEQARKIILVVGLDKVVRNRDEAIFVARCMAGFGAEIIPLSLPGKAGHGESMNDVPFGVSAEQTTKTIHVLLIDNGRSGLLKSRYKELMMCIGCRACLRSCPASPFFNEKTRWTPRDYLFNFLTGSNPSLDLCLQCRTCQAHCPLGIDLPDMILEARAEAQSKAHRTIQNGLFPHVETTAKLSSSIPWLANRVADNKALRWLGEKMLDISKAREIPRAQPESFTRWFRSGAGKDVKGT